MFQDALILQRLVLQSKLQLSEDEESVPDVSAAIQEMLATIFTALYNHQDEEGRCYSDSMAELPEHDIIDGKKYGIHYQIFLLERFLRAFPLYRSTYIFFIICSSDILHYNPEL